MGPITLHGPFPEMAASGKGKRIGPLAVYCTNLLIIVTEQGQDKLRCQGVGLSPAVVLGCFDHGDDVFRRCISLHGV